MSTPAPSRRSPSSFNKAKSAKSQAKSSVKAKSPPKTKRLSFVKRISNFFTRKSNKNKYSLTPKNEDEVTQRKNSSGRGTDNFYKSVEEFSEQARERKTREEKAATTIKSFFKKTTVRRKANFLGKKCPDSGVCMALGIYTDKIKDFFGGFTHFLYCKNPIKRIGSPSANGFVNQLEYVKGSYEDMSLTLRKDRSVRSAAPPPPSASASASASAITASKQIQYTAYAILKSSARVRADNLMYEYIVGQFLNKQNKFFPCFLETYGLYKYKSDKYWKNMYNSVNKTVENVKEGLELQTTIDYSVACSQSIYLAILIQYFKGVKTLEEALANTTFSSSHQLIYVLFQIYYTLAGLADTFTHYDLHWNNVLLYEPIKDKYIEYHYHHKGTVTSFKSNYMVKIIDYGRSYFYDNRDNNSAKIHEEVCKTTQCQTNTTEIYKCGENYGFGWLHKQNKTKNVTADLRLLIILFSELNDNKLINKTQPYLKPLLKTVIYNMNENMVIENKKSGLPYAINNVTDAFLYIKSVITNILLIADENKKQFENKQKLGDLYIYDDGKPIEFIPYQPNNREIDALITKLEIQISDLKTKMFQANKSRDVDREEHIEEAYKEIVLLEGKITDLFCDRIDNINDLASLETIRKDIETDITKSSLYSKLSKSAKSAKTDYPYEPALLDLHTKELNDKLAYVDIRLKYLLRKAPYMNTTRSTRKNTNFSKRETDV